MVFHQNSWKKAFFIVKMTGLAVIRPVSSDLWKAPSVKVFWTIFVGLFLPVFILERLCVNISPITSTSNECYRLDRLLIYSGKESPHTI